jgi:hypothetical protein
MIKNDTARYLMLVKMLILSIGVLGLSSTAHIVQSRIVGERTKKAFLCRYTNEIVPARQKAGAVSGLLRDGLDIHRLRSDFIEAIPIIEANIRWAVSN